MKQLILLFTFFFVTLTLYAQLRLNVEGDGVVDGQFTVEDRLSFPNRSVYIGQNARANGANDLENTFVGYLTGFRTASFGNTFIGAYSGVENFFGNDNTFIGRKSGEANTDGDANTYLGSSAGATMELGAANTMLGFRADKLSGAGDLEKAIAIGYDAKVGCNNCAVIGGTGDDAVNVGMGINQDLNARLSLLNDSNGNNPQLRLIEGEADNFARIRLENTSQAGHWILAARGNAADNPRFNFYYNDDRGNTGNIMSVNGVNFNVGIGTVNPDPAARLDVAGDIYINGVFHASDLRFKKNIRPVRKPMALLEKVNGVTYEFRREEFRKKGFSRERQYGLIAQELEQVMPELVRNREDGYKAVNYEGLIPVLIEGVKEQQDQIGQLEKTVQRQERQIAELTSLVNRLLAEGSDNNQNSELLLPGRSRLNQNHPNPFTESTRINYQIVPGVEEAYLQITNVEGKVIGQHFITQTGKGQVVIQANSYPAGTYFYSLVVDGKVTETKKMILTP